VALSSACGSGGSASNDTVPNDATPASDVIASAVPDSLIDGWPQHSRERPAPPVEDPGPYVAIERPADAVVLFDGSSLDAWEMADSSASTWKIVGDAFEVVPGTGTMRTREAYGDVELHIEWMSPNPPVGSDQDRGNSGVFFGGGRYEVQILDSYDNPTYPDGQAAALYGQYAPRVNVSRKPGEWQTYDIVYKAPRFADGKLVSPAMMTVKHNGVLVHDNQALVGPTANRARVPYVVHEERLPIQLQDHSHPVRFRNVWLRVL
jgi:hypothetical protein